MEREGQLHPSRRPGDPTIVGDDVAGQTLSGIAFEPSSAPTSANDRMLFDGDRKTTRVPPASSACLPSSLPAAQLRAPMPPADLKSACQSSATALDPALPKSFRDFLERPGSWQTLGKEVVKAVRAEGHKIWLAGGATRDLVALTPVAGVNDLDLCGTAPPGQYADIVTAVLVRLGLGWEVSINPRSLVCSVVLPGPEEERALEYRSLKLGGFLLEGTSSSMTMDAEARDFRFNAVFYDFDDEMLIDPFGLGLADIRTVPSGGAAVRRFVPAMPEPPSWRKGGEIVLRAIKFFHRWRSTYSLDVADFTKWVNGSSVFSGKPPSVDDKNHLRGYAKKTLQKVPDDQVFPIADRLNVRQVVEQMLEP